MAVMAVLVFFLVVARIHSRDSSRRLVEMLHRWQSQWQEYVLTASKITTMTLSPSLRNESMAILAVSSFVAGAVCYALLGSIKKKKYETPAEIRSSSLARHVDLAVQLALQAGANMFPYCDEKGTEAELTKERQLSLEFKGNPEDFCTQVDVENENLVMKGIQAMFPSDSIIGEETTGTGPIPPLTDNLTWIIDPIDGTTNFAAGLPLTCVSIGLCDKGKPVMGVVYVPMMDELYIAVSGHGAYRNGKRLLSKPSSEKTLSQAIVGFEFGYVRQPEPAAAMIAASHKILVHGCRGMRQFGSGVLDLCYVALGRIDAVYSGVAGEGWKPWDLCAGAVIVQEAGCLLETFDQHKDEPFDLYTKHHICATNRQLLEEVRSIVKDEWIRMDGKES